MAVLPVAVTVAQEKSSASPQPRVRLDPQTRTAIAEPETSATAGAPTGRTAAPVVLMDRYVVKGKYEVPLGPAPLTQATGPFTWSGGGRFFQKNVGAAQVEVGLWPYVSIFADDERFKSGPAGPGFGKWDLVHIKW